MYGANVVIYRETHLVACTDFLRFLGAHAVHALPNIRALLFNVHQHLSRNSTPRTLRSTLPHHFSHPLLIVIPHRLGVSLDYAQVRS